MLEHRGMYDDFAGYRVPTDAEVAEALRAATVVVDTNVLFSLYRYSNSTRESLFDVLERVGERLFVPHQVMREFWRNRLEVIADRGRGHTELLDQVGKHLRATAAAVETWARSASIDVAERDELIGRVEALRHDLEDAAQRQAPLVVSMQGGAAGDPVLRRLELLLTGHVGAAAPPHEWAVAVEEGADRVRRLVPPGYMDAAKADSGRPEGASGDYLVWSQALAETKARGGNLLLITGDQKEDWWLRRQSVFVGPRPELVEELREACGAQLYMLRPVDLLRHADALDVRVRAESVVEADRGPIDSLAPLWTADGVVLLLARLDAEGWDHTAVIRRAAELGGLIDRAEVYAICRYSEDRMLRGFTRPATRIMRDLQAEGLVAEGVTQPLTTEYDTELKAERFRVPDEMVEILGTAAVRYSPS